MPSGWPVRWNLLRLILRESERFKSTIQAGGTCLLCPLLLPSFALCPWHFLSPCLSLPLSCPPPSSFFPILPLDEDVVGHRETNLETHSLHRSYRDSPNHNPTTTWLQTWQAFLSACYISHLKLKVGTQDWGAFCHPRASTRSKTSLCRQEPSLRAWPGQRGPGLGLSRMTGQRGFLWGCNVTIPQYSRAEKCRGYLACSFVFSRLKTTTEESSLGDAFG